MITILVARQGREAAEEAKVGDLPALLEDESAIVWVNLPGDDEQEARRVVTDVFHFHPLAVEECFEEREHPKVEVYDGYVYVITHGVASQSKAQHLVTSEIDAFVGKRYRSAARWSWSSGTPGSCGGDRPRRCIWSSTARPTASSR
jgi:magnesium transporter